MVFKELAVGDTFKTNNNNTIYRKIEPQKRTPSGCGCDKVNSENVADGSKMKFSDFLTVEKVG